MKKICKLCGKEFEPKPHQGKRLVCYEDHYATCEVCNKQFKIQDFNYPSRTCSTECRAILRRRNAEATSLERYGVRNAGYTPESKAKIEATNLAKYGNKHYFASETAKSHNREVWLDHYGVDNPQKSKEIREKSQQTCLEKYGDKSVFGANSSIRKAVESKNIEQYGVANLGGLPSSLEKSKQTQLAKYGKPFYTQTEEYREKYIKTCLAKYGTTHHTHSEAFKKHCIESSRKKYGVDWPMQSDEVKQALSGSCMKKYGVPWYCMLPQVREANHSIHSKTNERFGELLSANSIEFTEEYRIEDRLYDFRINNTNILLEIDPTPTHTTADGYFAPTPWDYQYKKSQLAIKNGFWCIHIFDWDDPAKIVNLLNPNKSKIYARNTTLREVSRNECKQFLDQYHLQGTCNNQSKRFGLYFQDNLIQIMTFGSPRYNSGYQFELLRLCTDPNYIVVGGSEKLFSHFCKQYNPKSIISYCDNAKFQGTVYSKLGFDLHDCGTPTKVWSKNKNYITDNLLRQRGYDQLFNTNYGKGSSNEKLMLQHNWLPIYNCGQSVYTWRSRE